MKYTYIKGVFGRLAVLSGLVAGAFAFASCVNDLDVDLGDNEPLLVVNSIMDTDDTDHYIYVLKSSNGDIDTVRSATVKVTINGVSVGNVSKYADNSAWRDYESASRYGFSGKISPGDVVRIDVSADGLSACAEATAPSEPEIISVDTATIKKYDKGLERMEEYLELGTRIRDVQGENSYYRLKIKRGVDVTFSFDNEALGYDNPPEVRFSVKSVDYEIFSDPILTNGYSLSVDEDNIFNDLAPWNDTRIFSDELFRDKDATIHAYYDGSEDYIRQALPEQYVTETKFGAGNFLSVCFQHISQDTYGYFQAINVGNAMGYEANPIVEPTRIPSNVDGGLGVRWNRYIGRVQVRRLLSP